MQDYKHKYFSYKIKYLKLKNKLNIDGGYTEEKTKNKCILWQKNYLKNVCIYSKGQCLNLCQNINFLKQVFNSESFYNILETEEIIKNLETLKKSGSQEESLLKKKMGIL